MYCLNMLAIALELARENRVYEDLATKFFEHFLYIAAALNNIGGVGHPALGRRGRVLLRRPALAETARSSPLKVRSLVGLIPLLAVETIEPAVLEALPEFKRRLRLVPDATGPSWRAWCRAGRSRAWASGGCWRSCAAIA